MITLGGGPADRDQLVIETGGATTGEWALSVTDAAGQKYATTPIGSTLVASVPGGGRYSVAASVTARAATAGGKDSVEQRLRATVKVTSLRNAMAAKWEGAPLPDLDLPLTDGHPARNSRRKCSRHLRGTGPVSPSRDAEGKASDLSVQSVTVLPAGGGGMVEMVVVGTKREPTTVRMVGVSEVRGDSLRLADLRLAAGQPNVEKKKDLRAAMEHFGRRAASAAVPTGFDYVILSVIGRGKFPVRVGDLCVEPLPPGTASFLGTVPSPDDSTEFLTYFSLTPGPLQTCGRPK